MGTTEQQLSERWRHSKMDHFQAHFLLFLNFLSVIMSDARGDMPQCAVRDGAPSRALGLRIQYSPIGEDQFDFQRLRIELPHYLEDLVTCRYSDVVISVIYQVGESTNKKTRVITDREISEGWSIFTLLFTAMIGAFFKSHRAYLHL